MGTQVQDHDHWKSVAQLPDEISQSANGKYSVTHHKEATVSPVGPNYAYSIWFQTPPFDPVSLDRLQSLQLITECHDQGSCADPNAGNWTWFELVILENELAKTPKVKDGIVLTWISHLNRFCKADYDWKAGKVFGSSHNIFNQLEDGNVIAVRLCARYEGWKLYARSAYLLLELGDRVPRPPFSYGAVVTQTKAMQEVFKEINQSVLPDPPTDHIVSDEVFSAEMITSASDRPLRVLALDGGGVRGIAALMLLDAVLKKVGSTKKPCEIFDMIAGTSTGGFIAIMLGRFKMSIAECLARYSDTMKTVFPVGAWKKTNMAFTGEMYDASDLEKVIRALVKERLGDENAPLMDANSDKDSCKVLVMATKSVGANNSAPAIFRSYNNPLNKSELPDIKIWQAARATSAAPTYFKPMTIGNVSFVDGGLQANDPLGWMWNEMLGVFGPARPTNCFLSIGTGLPLSMTMTSGLVSVAESVPSIATNSEITNILFRSLINAFAPQGMAKKYWRFNVGDGFPDWVLENGVGVWKLQGKRLEQDLGSLDDSSDAATAKTRQAAIDYLSTPAAAKMVAEAAEALKKELS